MQLFDLNGNVAVVTGGSGVLGQTMASALAEAGAQVVVLARTSEKVEEVARSIRERGGQAMAVSASVLVEAQLLRVRDSILERWEKIDVLVNCAGGNVPEATLLPGADFFALPPEAIRRVLELNLMGTILPSRIFGEAMARRKRGSIINISSMASDRAITRVVGYSAAKAAVENFTRWLAVEWARSYGDGLRVNAIAPGFFIGDQNRDLLLNPDGSLTERGQNIVQRTPMGRFGKSDELAGTLIWLSSEASRFVTGTVIPVDGGFSAFSGV